ncbi:PREDICTED: ell-associated factor Eaf [Papilio xuthus]|uniref:Ell-associated factor Eaf n=2 Tax=Papilio TaxID=7145 RepID=A0A194PV17_PAPXU|nr:PREDICTED: ell-associated factor Eaf [Papilio xuthus]KPI96833.1 Ell-associated factor Eaf [Papilio xuthus]
MADKHSLNYDVRELKLGSSFTNNKTSQYHTIKYDFKPASVDVNKMATVDVGTNNQVTVTVPHLDGAGVPQTVFKGSQRPYTKECVLIIDRVTGEITLEKLSSNIQVKKTRQETAQKPRPLTPVTTDFTNTTQRSSSRTRVATNRRTNNNANANGGQANSQSRFNNNGSKPQNMVRSPSRVKTSPPQAPWSAGGNSTLASLPMIGLDDAPSASPPAARPHPPPAPLAPPAALPPVTQHVPHVPPAQHVPHVPHVPPAPHIPQMPNVGHVAHTQHMHAPPPAPAQPPSAASQDDSSSSSSSDSDSDSGSGSDSDDNDSPAPPRTHQPPTTNGTVGNPALPSVLNDDLCLSESGSDSD